MAGHEPITSGHARALVGQGAGPRRAVLDAVCSAAAPVLLAAGSTIGGHLQPRPYNAMTGTVSAWPPWARPTGG